MNYQHLAAVLLLLLGTLTWIFWSVWRHPPADQGDGLGEVVVNAPRPVRLYRPLGFFAVLVVYALVVVAARTQIAGVYAKAVISLAVWVMPEPTLIAPFSHHLETGLRVMIAAAIVALALVLRASPQRRLAVALHSLIYVGLAVLLDCLVVVTSASTGLPIAYVGIEGIVLNLVLWSTVMLRVFFTTFAVPRPSQVPVAKGVYRLHTLQAALLCLAVLALLGLLTVSILLLGGLGHDLYIYLGFMTYALMWTFFILLLRCFGALQRPEPAGDWAPPIHVIMCAYNESEGIVDTLGSIDAAAQNYRGEVRVTLADDGSEDDTVAKTKRCMSDFLAARGEIIFCPHGGKSSALNLALSRVRGPIAVRIDADVVISPNAFSCLPRWFQDPSVGNVGGSTFPRMGRSWIHRMRLIECLYGYLFVRPGLMVVDAVPCVPGTFQAFRPDPVRAVGGMVRGMNGEDADLTMQIGRLGYRAVLDRDIVIHEDVPTNLRQFREQRLRWYRSGAHLFARHGPFQGRSAGPRVWLTTVRAAVFRFMMLVRPIVYLYAAVWALEQPTGTRNLWYVFVLFGSAVAPMLLCSAVVAVRHGYARYLPWFLLWYPTFVLIRRVVMIESILTLPTRPVQVPWPALSWHRPEGLEVDVAG